MPDRDAPSRIALAIAKAPAEPRERRVVLAARGVASALVLAAYSLAGFLSALVALAPLVLRPLAGRHLPSASSRQPSAGARRRALPG